LNNLYIASHEELLTSVAHVVYENKGGIWVTSVVVGVNCGGIIFFFGAIDISPEICSSGLACDRKYAKNKEQYL